MATRFTEDQLSAINAKDNNILISAAAGSGKTAVLTQRIVNKLLDGHSIDNFLVLTFSNASANDMKEKIYESVSKHEELKEELSKIATSNISTFDAYAQKIVKKYHYLLKINSNFKIGDAAIFDVELSKTIDNLFKQLILEENQEFLKVCMEYEFYDTNKIKEFLISLYKSLNNQVDFNVNITEFFKEETINYYVNEYYNIIFNSIDNLKRDLELLQACCIDETSNKLFLHNSEQLRVIFELDNLDEDRYLRIRDSIFNMNLKKSTTSKKIDNVEEVNEVLKKMTQDYISLKELFIFESVQDMINKYKATKKNIEFFIEQLNKIYQQMSLFKFTNNIYEFIDIKRMSINILKDYQDVREEIKDNIVEILLDEYQDTDDVQEEFVNLISKRNIYMVGDVKQSIYGFRGANPNIFMNKYETFVKEGSKDSEGILVTLNKNFRSNSEVIEATNDIFAPLMNKNIGGVTYDNTQALVFGNKSYEQQSEDYDYKMQIFNYDYDKEFEISEVTYEAKIIAKDIREKVDNGYEIIKKGKRRPVTYSDFLILTRNKKRFEIFKKVFEEYNIPLKTHSEDKFKISYDVKVLKNILVLISNYNKCGNFKNEIASVSRSFLFDYNDNDIHECISNYNSELKLSENLETLEKLNVKISKLSSLYHSLSLENLIYIIMSEFDFLHNIDELEDSESSFERINNFINSAISFDAMKKNLNQFIIFLNEIFNINFDGDFNFNVNLPTTDVVEMMTIHKSKGLEFPICYICRLNEKFNFRDNSAEVSYDNSFGFLIKKEFEGYMYQPFVRKIQAYYNLQNLISEELRLLYVALTRAESKLILVSDFNFEDKSIKLDVADQEKLKAKSYSDLLQLIGGNLQNYVYFKELEDSETLSTDKLQIEKVYQEENTNFKTTNLQFKLNTISRPSKDSLELMDFETINKLNFGNELHEEFESIDFKDLDMKNISEEKKKYLEKFLNLNLHKEAINIYQEYEYNYQGVHGIIDLLIEYEDRILILDYKTNNIDDEAYIEQLKTYKEYIKCVSTKDIRLALYSILQGKIKYVD